MQRVRHTFSRWSGMALLRAIYWRHLRGYKYEVCHDCGRPVRVVWMAPDGEWERVMGGPGGVLCIPCFDDRSPYSLRWGPSPL